MSDDLVKDCLSVLYNCCICVSTVMPCWVNFITHPSLKLISSWHIWFALCFLREWNVTFFLPFQTEGVTKSLASRNDFVLYLFTLMTNKKTFLQTATLIEDILGVKKVGFTSGKTWELFLSPHNYVNLVLTGSSSVSDKGSTVRHWESLILMSVLLT